MRVLFITDEISMLQFYKDTSFAMMLEAQRRKYQIHYCRQQQLYFLDNQVYAHTHQIQVNDNPSKPYKILSETKHDPLKGYDVILMRKDPPFNLNYIYTTYLLEHVERLGVLVINKPQSLRDCNEKLFTLSFLQCLPACMVSSQKSNIVDFIKTYDQCVLKPLDGMAGQSIYLTHANDVNLPVIIERWTHRETTPIMVQKFIPAIQEGDKRIILINGNPVPYALSRIPQKGEIRGNLAAGGTGVGVELNDRDRWICAQIGPTLKEKGLVFVGIDVIGDYLTEINVTSPTCVREIDKAFNTNIGGDFFECVEKILKN